MNHNDRHYDDRYVAFIDLLGFSALVRRADDLQIRERVEKLVSHLQRVPAMFDNIKFTQFSDCVVLSTEKSPDGLLIILLASRLIAESVMLEGCLVRGGIASGNLVHSKALIYGPGMLNAYRHDGAGAPPRIVIAPDVVSDIEASEFRSPRLELRLDAADGVHYLHTLLAVEYYDPDDTPVAFPSAIWMMPEIVRLMCDAAEVSTGVRAKWRWFRDYWNETVGARQGRRC